MASLTRASVAFKSLVADHLGVDEVFDGPAGQIPDIIAGKNHGLTVRIAHRTARCTLFERKQSHCVLFIFVLGRRSLMGPTSDDKDLSLGDPGTWSRRLEFCGFEIHQLWFRCSRHCALEMPSEGQAEVEVRA